MSTSETTAAVRGFEIGFDESEIAEMRGRIAATRWAERAYPDNLVHYNKLDRGGHFAAWEQPQLFTEELRTAFRSLRA